MHRGNWLFCFNVKLYNLDLSFGNLLEVHKKSGYCENPDATWVEGCRSEYAAVEQYLWHWGVEDAGSQFTTGRAGYPDDDAYNMLWDGRACVTRFSFCGRSGGWLVMSRFNGLTLTTELELEELDYRELRDLAEMVHFVSRAVEDRHQCVETAAAFAFFENTCRDVKDRKQLEETWMKDWSAGHEFELV